MCLLTTENGPACDEHRGHGNEEVASMQHERYPEWLRSRFWAKVNQTDTCWLWTASLTGAAEVPLRNETGDVADMKRRTA